jgi:hypothetical protein
MDMPEALEPLDTEITAVCFVSFREYEACLKTGELPDWCRERLNYTDALTRTPSSSVITGYKAMLVLTEDDPHGIAVCGGERVYRSALMPHGAEILNNRVKMMANYIAELSRVPGRVKDGANFSFDHLNAIFQTRIAADNGVGELLLAELKSREEISDIILHEDCLEISYALDFGDEALDTPDEWMNLMGLIGCNLHDVHLLHDSEEHDLATIVDLTPDTLTGQGKKDWADVLNAVVTNISHGYYGTQIDLSGCKASRLRDFSYMLAGQCAASDYDKWVRDGEPQGIRQTPAMQEAEAAFREAMRKIQGVDEGKTPEWLGHAWTLAVKFSGESGIPCEDTYPALLKEFAAAFADVDRHFESCAYEIYNYKAAYMPQQLMDVANYLCEGGGPEDAYELAQEGCDFSSLATPEDDESQGMTLQ